MCSVNSLFACHPSFQMHGSLGHCFIACTELILLHMISHLDTEVKKETFQIATDPCKVVGLAEPHHEGSRPADSAQFHQVFTFKSTILFNFVPQSVKLYELKTRNSQLRMVNSRNSLSGLLNRAFTQLLCLGALSWKLSISDFVDASLAHN